MSNKNGGAAAMQPRGVTPIIGQRFLEVDIPAQARKIPEGYPVPVAALFHGDKEHLDRIEAKLDLLLKHFAVVESKPAEV